VKTDAFGLPSGPKALSFPGRSPGPHESTGDFPVRLTSFSPAAIVPIIEKSVELRGIPRKIPRRGGIRMQNKIGEFLVQIGAMQQYQVDDVLRVQESGDSRMFGEIAIELGYINDAAIKKYLDYRHSQTGGAS